MGFIYTGFDCRKKGSDGVFKIGMTEDSVSPINRLYANHLCETGCIKLPNADKETLLLLESVARYTCSHSLGLKKQYEKTDFFCYTRKTRNQYEQVFDFADEVINAIAEECEFRGIPYELDLKGYTMQGQCARLCRERGCF